ncbi:Lcl domain-containing protein [Flavilitoribacter nigricans]|uniref:Lcl C-terminal domain-containing protein n=1 Tax=Flavilitoribacter nigricans (strain ATCC 23147 / DSM 23189 / NBRC 102662 / NCIMB 1420 / SS-2) TaxID=1122177 RepID=A0A2D0N9D6_FLAN2|nr:DUF1566 domain-containing protein [Flavilitoribacter nigricans]PHN05134.1 hypothetical protein CRP01_19120 [Flavilitoribacter nigricans DSM 23189 = NBRC 102662]
MKRILLAMVGILLLAACEKESAVSVTDTDLEVRGSTKLKVLHNTGSESNPWEVIEVADVAYQNAHLDHGDKIVGDTHAGGIIFYLTDTPTDLNGDGKPDLGLVAANRDFPISGAPGTYAWGCYGIPISGADGTAIGTGAQNTQDILAACTGANTAAHLADAYSGAGYDDWFLPSQDELDLMYQKLHLNGVGDFTGTSYWSSSEAYTGTYGDVWYHRFSTGYQGVAGRTSPLWVRAVRAF